MQLLFQGGSREITLWDTNLFVHKAKASAGRAVKGREGFRNLTC